MAVFTTPNGISYEITEFGLISIKYGTATLASGSLALWDAADFHKIPTALALGKNRPLLETKISNNINFYANVNENITSRSIDAPIGNTVKVYHNYLFGVATYTYALSGEDLLVTCAIKSVGSYEVTCPAVGGLFLNFSSAPSGIDYVVTANEEYKLHPSNRIPTYGAYLKDKNWGIGVCAIHTTSTNIIPTLVHFDYKNSSETSFQKNRVLEFHHLDQVVNASHSFGFAIRCGYNNSDTTISQEFLMGYYKTNFNAIFGSSSIYTKTNKRWIMGYDFKDASAISGANPYGYASTKRLDLTSDAATIITNLQTASGSNSRGIVFYNPAGTWEAGPDSWEPQDRVPAGSGIRPENMLMPSVSEFNLINNILPTLNRTIGFVTEIKYTTVRRSFLVDSFDVSMQPQTGFANFGTNIEMIRHRYRQAFNYGGNIYLCPNSGKDVSCYYTATLMRSELGNDAPIFFGNYFDLVATQVGFHTFADYANGKWSTRTPKWFIDLIKWLIGDVDVYVEKGTGTAPANDIFEVFALSNKMSLWVTQESQYTNANTYQGYYLDGNGAFLSTPTALPSPVTPEISSYSPTSNRKNKSWVTGTYLNNSNREVRFYKTLDNRILNNTDYANIAIVVDDAIATPPTTDWTNVNWYNTIFPESVTEDHAYFSIDSIYGANTCPFIYNTSGGSSTTRILNPVQIWGIPGVDATKLYPGRTYTLIGRNLKGNRNQTVWLWNGSSSPSISANLTRCPTFTYRGGGNSESVGLSQQYMVTFTIPSNTAAGNYTLRVFTNDNEWGLSNAINVTLLANTEETWFTSPPGTNRGVTHIQLNESFAITSISNPSSPNPYVVTTSSAHGFIDGETVIITSNINHTGSVSPNGQWTISVLNSTSFELVGSVGNAGTAGTGGLVSGSSPVKSGTDISKSLINALVHYDGVATADKPICLTIPSGKFYLSHTIPWPANMGLCGESEDSTIIKVNPQLVGVSGNPYTSKTFGTVLGTWNDANGYPYDPDTNGSPWAGSLTGIYAGSADQSASSNAVMFNITGNNCRFENLSIIACEEPLRQTVNGIFGNSSGTVSDIIFKNVNLINEGASDNNPCIFIRTGSWTRLTLSSCNLKANNIIKETAGELNDSLVENCNIEGVNTINSDSNFGVYDRRNLFHNVSVKKMFKGFINTSSNCINNLIHGCMFSEMGQDRIGGEGLISESRTSGKFYSVVSSGSTSTFTTTIDGLDHAGKTVIVVAGKGVGQYRIISSSNLGTGEQTVSSAFFIQLDNTSKVIISNQAATDCAWVNNTFIDTATGPVIMGSAFGVDIVNNYIREASSGVLLSAINGQSSHLSTIWWVNSYKNEFYNSSGHVIMAIATPTAIVSQNYPLISCCSIGNNSYFGICSSTCFAAIGGTSVDTNVYPSLNDNDTLLAGKVLARIAVFEEDYFGYTNKYWTWNNTPLMHRPWIISDQAVTVIFTDNMINSNKFQDLTLNQSKFYSTKSSNYTGSSVTMMELIENSEGGVGIAEDIAAIKAKTDQLVFISGDVRATLDGEAVASSGLDATSQQRILDIKSKTDQLTFTGTDVRSTLDGELVALNGTQEGKIDAIKTKTDQLTFTGTDVRSTLDGELVALNGTQEGKIDAIKTKTDLLTFTGTDVRSTLDGELVALNGTQEGKIDAIKTQTDTISAVKAKTDQLIFVGQDVKATLDGELVALNGTQEGKIDAIKTQTDTISAVKAKTDQLVFISGDVRATLDGEAVASSGLDPTSQQRILDIKAKTDLLTFTGTDVRATLDGELVALNGTQEGKIDAIKTKTDQLIFVGQDVKATLDGELVALNGTQEGKIDAIKTQTDTISAVKLKTDQLTFTGTDVRATLDGETVAVNSTQLGKIDAIKDQTDQIVFVNGEVRSTIVDEFSTLSNQLNTIINTGVNVNVPDLDLIEDKVDLVLGKTNQLTFTNGSVQSKLASDGLDNISMTEPVGRATNFREMLVQLWRRFFGKVVFDKTNNTIKTYKDNNLVATIQEVTSTATQQIQGKAEDGE